MRLWPKKRVRWVLLRQEMAPWPHPWAKDFEKLIASLQKPPLTFRWRWVARLVELIIVHTVFFDLQRTVIISQAEWATERLKGGQPIVSEILGRREWSEFDVCANTTDFGDLAPSQRRG